jgi:hypothetical protein
MTRPQWQELPDVEDGALLIRFILPGALRAERPKGNRVDPSACQSGDYQPSETSYGASVYVESRLRNGVDDLFAACPRWRGWRFVQLQVALVRALALDVKYTPMDCEFPEIADAHASLIGMNRSIRTQFIALLDAQLD